MTRIYFALLITLIVFFIMTSICVSQKIIEVVIAPGHGGPGASKYGNNGGGYNEGRGSSGPDSLLTEQWVNLQVSFLLRDSINTYCLDTGYVLMTRTTDTANVTYWYRANLANTANGAWPAKAFISLHHNGLPIIKLN
jgi:N-acetylmuramoyl-L-alanine amidase